MDFFLVSSASSAFCVEPSRSNMTNLSFQTAEKKPELLRLWKMVHLQIASDGKYAKELLTWYSFVLPQNW